MMPASHPVASISSWLRRCVFDLAARYRYEVMTAVYAVTWLMLLVVGPRGGVASLILNSTYFVICGLTVHQQFLVARRSPWDPATRRAWTWLAASATWLLVNGAAWTVWLLVDPTAQAADWSSLIDAGYVPLAIVGFLLLPRNPRFSWRDRGVLLDAGLLALGIVALS